MRRRLGRPRAVLFDWDSTLVDNWGAIRDALNAALVAMGHKPWTHDETRRRVRESLRDSFPTMFGERWPEARRVFYRAFEEGHLASLQPLPGAEPLLAALSEAGVYLGVVSNKRGDLLRREASHLGWSGLFGRLVGAGDAEADKPAAAPVALALAPSGIAGGREVWMVGDAAIDVECARNAGCLALVVGDPARQTAEFRGWPPDWRGRDLDQLAALARDVARTQIKEGERRVPGARTLYNGRPRGASRSATRAGRKRRTRGHP
ncbi:MAG: HAD family hydrolase [Alphaproteobacteria bacterium]